MAVNGTSSAAMREVVDEERIDERGRGRKKEREERVKRTAERSMEENGKEVKRRNEGRKKRTNHNKR